MYEILKTTILEAALNITFYKKVVFDYDSEERYFCLTAQNHDSGTDEDILLDFIYDSDEFDEKTQTIICDFLLNEIASNIESLAYDLGLKDLKIIAGHLGIIVGNKYFGLEEDNYSGLQSSLTDYVKTLNNALSTK